MNAIVKAEGISAAALEHVLGTGDLAKLTTQQRVEYYGQVCRSIGINPLTRPFRFMSFQGQTVLYATRDCTDQLRNLRKISVSIVDKQLDGDLFIVTARATTADQRCDEDVGAVTMGQLRGEARANAIMKAMTKAKRRVTMSICGLGFLDETEVETLQGAVTYDAEAEPPPARIETTREAINAAVPFPTRQPVSAEPKQTVGEFLAEVEGMLSAADTADQVDAIAALPRIQRALTTLKPEPLDRLNAMIADALERTMPGAAQDYPATSSDDVPFPGDAPQAA